MTRVPSRSTADAISRALDTRAIQPCVIAANGPLRVTIGGATVRGVAVLGLTYTVGAPGIAIMNQPNMPVIIPTA